MVGYRRRTDDGLQTEVRVEHHWEPNVLILVHGFVSGVPRTDEMGKELP